MEDESYQCLTEKNGVICVVITFPTKIISLKCQKWLIFLFSPNDIKKSV